MPDRDEFTRIKGGLRKAIEPLWGTAQGAPLNPADAALALDRLFYGGVPSLGPLLDALQVSPKGSDASEVIESTVRQHASGKLDLVLARAAQRALLDGALTSLEVVRGFVRDAVDFGIVHPKEGVLDKISDADPEHLHAALAPACDAAVQRLVANPGFKRLGLARGLKRAVNPNESLPLLIGSSI